MRSGHDMPEPAHDVASGEAHEEHSVQDKFIWSRQAVTISDLVKLCDTPQVVRLAEVSEVEVDGLTPDVPYLLYCTRQGSKVLATELSWDASVADYRRQSDRLCLIPVSHAGWFELMPSEGRAIECFETISDLAREMPRRFLTRTPITGYSKLAAKSNARGTQRLSLGAGQVLDVLRVYTEYSQTHRPLTCMQRFLWRKTSDAQFKAQKYLHCEDCKGNSVFIPFAERGLFSPIGEPGSRETDAVYRISDLVRYLDLPLDVQLVYGTSPPGMQLTLRLEAVFNDQSAMLCGVSREPTARRLIELSQLLDLSFFRAMNRDTFAKDTLVREILCGCDNLVEQFSSQIKLVDSSFQDILFQSCEESENGGGMRDMGELIEFLNAESQFDLIRVNSANFIMSRKGSLNEQGYTMPYHVLEQLYRSVNSKPSSQRTSKTNSSTPRDSLASSTSTAVVKQLSLQRRTLPVIQRTIPQVPSDDSISLSSYSISSTESYHAQRHSSPVDEMCFDQHLSIDTKVETSKGVQNNALLYSPPQIIGKATISHGDGSNPSSCSGSTCTLNSSCSKTTCSTVELQNEYESVSHSVRQTSEYQRLHKPITHPSPRSSPVMSSPSSSRQQSLASADSGYNQDSYLLSGAPRRALFIPEDTSSLSVADVTLSLHYIGMRDDIVHRFNEESIDGEILTEFDESLLKDSFPELRRLEIVKLLRFIRGWRPRHSGSQIILSGNNESHLLDSTC